MMLPAVICAPAPCRTIINLRPPANLIVVAGGTSYLAISVRAPAEPGVSLCRVLVKLKSPPVAKLPDA